MTSKKKQAANRKNSQKSTGPQTARGKNASRKNALQHGIFSRELYVSDQDQPEYANLRVELLHNFRQQPQLEHSLRKG
jgi:hypothetical protein